MSSPSITHYFPFPRIRIIRQRVSRSGQKAYLKAVPDKQFKSLCYICGRQASGVHSQERCWIQDLDFGQARVWTLCHYRKIVCPHCQKIPIEELDLFDPYFRVTKRLARYIFELCKIMTVQEVARHLGLGWKTVKAVDQKFMEEEEVSIRKGHRYLWLSWTTRQGVWFGWAKTEKPGLFGDSSWG